MNQYDKYKDSGIKWIGEVPEQWEVKNSNIALAGRGENILDNQAFGGAVKELLMKSVYSKLNETFISRSL
jgi:hypothetical protein